MANYICTIRTNYFHVKDEQKFRLLMENVYGTEGDILLWEDKDEEGNTVFGFGIDGKIAGVSSSCEEQFEEFSYGEFIECLQDCVADDDAIIIFESGHEKMRYVVGNATVITSKENKFLSIDKLAIHLAQKMLDNSSWETRYTY